VQKLLLIVFAALVAALLLPPLLRRWRPGLAQRVRLAGSVLGHGAVAVVCGLGAVELARDGEPLRLAAAVFLGLLALSSLGFGALFAWLLIAPSAEGEDG
jgi:hypothetical protein